MKNILIIGAGKGIGLSLVKLLAHTHNIYALTKSESKELEQTNATVFYGNAKEDDVWNNITLPETLDGLVYCPGSINLKPFRSLQHKDYLADFEQNVMGAIKATQQCLSLLKKSNNASIVFFSTVAVQLGLAFHTSIATSKGAIEGLTRSLAAELAPSIRVNAIAPSLTQTPLTQSLLNTQEKIEANTQKHPLKKIGQPEDIAKIAALLLSDDASWITGQIIHVDGGLSTIKV